MARLIQSRQKDAQITFFYIDVQTFGKDFQSFYRSARENIRMVRAIPGDILRTDTDELEVIYFDPESSASEESVFDIVVLSVGLLPARRRQAGSRRRYAGAASPTVLEPDRWRPPGRLDRLHAAVSPGDRRRDR